jgi:hypothetical protein
MTNAPRADEAGVLRKVCLTETSITGRLTELMNKDLRPNSYLLGLLLT